MKKLSGLLVCVAFMSLLVSVASGQAQKPEPARDDLFSVSFPTENDGWACGRWGTILHTSDGGRTWARQESGTDFTLTSVFFVDPLNGWAVGDGATIVHTRDGGRTWKRQKSPVPLILMQSFFISPQRGWIVGERTHILFTENGGETWKVQFKAGDFILKSVSFCDALNGWAVGEYGFIYHTQDGGRSWVNQAGRFGQSMETGELVADPYLFGVLAVDPKTAWAVGIEGHVVRTTDGGGTWVPVDAHTRSTFFAVSANGPYMVIGGDGVLLSSKDKGRTWEAPRFEPPIDYSWLYGISRRKAGFVAVGADGAIYRSSADRWVKISY